MNLASFGYGGSYTANLASFGYGSSALYDLVIACAKDYALWQSFAADQQTTIVVAQIVTALSTETTGVVYVFSDEDTVETGSAETTVDSGAGDLAVSADTQEETVAAVTDEDTISTGTGETTVDSDADDASESSSSEGLLEYDDC